MTLNGFAKQPDLRLVVLLLYVHDAAHVQCIIIPQYIQSKTTATVTLAILRNHIPKDSFDWRQMS